MSQENIRISSHPSIAISQKGKDISFTYNGKRMSGKEGESVATALSANGVRIFSRSFKYHRPRGLYDNHGMGPEVLMTIDGTPNVCSDITPVKEGMVVKSQNAWPSPEFDIMSVNNWMVPLLPNGFYYKMFHKPKGVWPFFEKHIRKAAGIGAIDISTDQNIPRYEKRYRFPEVCVIGGGPAGIAAAMAALDKGKRVLLIDSADRLGGHSRHTFDKIEACLDNSLDGLSEFEAAQKLQERLEAQKNCEILTNATAFALYEDNLVAIQQGNDFFKVRADSVILCPGVSDRHLVFDNNDIPGIMTARGIEKMIAVEGLKPGARAVVATCHDGGYHTAKMLSEAGVQVVGISDTRRNDEVKSPYYEELNQASIPVYHGEITHRANGSKWIQSIELGSSDGRSKSRTLNCDLLVMAMGYKPQHHLLSMGHIKPVWDCQRQVLRITELPAGVYSAGEVQGYGSFATLFNEGWETGAAASDLSPAPESVRPDNEIISAPPADVESGGSRHFICKCMDVTRKEACLSIDEGYDQVETLKRYTSMGMGPCQGKSCQEAVARLAAQDTGIAEKEAMPTTVRPPYRPVSFGILSGRSHHLNPIRRTAVDAWHEENGALFLNAGLWRRPHSYGDPAAEVYAVRNKLGIIDVSTLGKLQLSGPDVMDFLHFLLPGKYKKLAVGKTRYSTMIGEDGILFEDGTLSHIEEGKYYLSTTTGNQDAIESLFRWWMLTDGYDVHLANLGSSYAAFNISGQSSREFLQKLGDIDMSNEAFPYMSCRKAKLAGSVDAWLFRIGFTGELSYEIHFPSEYAESLWEHILSEGQFHEIQAFGVETQRILRLEKGHLIPGVDTDALSNPYEAGVGFSIKDDKADFVGKAFLGDFKNRGIEKRLVPYKLKPGAPIPEDGVVVLDKGKLAGRVTSSRMSPTLGHGIGLAWIDEPNTKPGSKFQIRLADGRDAEGEVIDHAAYDPEGERLKA